MKAERISPLWIPFSPSDDGITGPRVNILGVEWGHVYCLWWCMMCVALPLQSLRDKYGRLRGNRTSADNLENGTEAVILFSYKSWHIYSNQTTTTLKPKRHRPGQVSLGAPLNHLLLWVRDELGLFGYFCDTSIDQRKHGSHWQEQNTKSNAHCCRYCPLFFKPHTHSPTLL